MKKLLVLAVLPLAAGIAFGVLVKSVDTSGAETSASIDKAAEELPNLANYQVINTRLPDEFNILVPITNRPQDLSIAINVLDDSNYYLLTLGDMLRIRKVESGIMFDVNSAPLPADLPPEFPVVVKRRANDITVAVNGAVVVQAYEGVFRGGRALISHLDGVNAQEVRMQRVAEIYFADNFMLVDEQSNWELITGTWRVNTLDNTGLASNAFSYMGQAGDEQPAVSVAGFWFWDNYDFHAAAKSEGGGDIGLVFYYRDPENYHLFRWNRRTGEGGGRKQLVKVSQGEEHILAEQEGGYTLDQWYTLRVRVNGQVAQAYIDGHLVFTAYDADLSYGRIGLYNASRSVAHFDDVFVRRDSSLNESFASGISHWQPLGGEWKVASEQVESNGTELRSLQGSVPQQGKIITGEEEWRNYTVTAVIDPLAEGEIGVTARYRDESNHYLYAITADGEHRLVRYHHGTPTTIATASQPFKTAQKNELFLACDEHILTAGINGTVIFEEWDTSIVTGKAGLFAAGTDSFLVHHVSVNMQKVHEPVLTTNEIFEAEKTMAIWASPLADWIDKYEVIDNKAFTVSWHRADFPGHVEMSVRLATLPPDYADVRLGICSATDKLSEGYSLSISRANNLRLELFRLGEPVASTELAAEAPMRISFERKGSFVVAYADYQPVLSFKDDSPLPGVTVGIGQRGMQVPKESIEVFCPNVYVYAFDQAPSDWRIATGTWHVTSRWSCDPRWSFFSGQSTSDAILWSKRRLKGDVTLEFAAAIQMDRERGGRYEYASDINATIAADGHDLTSGYSFMFGGWDNSSTRILRGETVVADNTEFKIPNQQDMHRRWFYLKVRKMGNKLQFFVDNKLVAEHIDPQPLTGDRLAIWTNNNGIMVAKVRISSLDASEMESPAFFAKGIPRSPYTKPNQEEAAKADEKKEAQAAN